MAWFEVDWDKFLKLSETEQAAIAKELMDLEEAADRNPLLFFEPHEKQVKFLSSHDRFKLFLGGNRSGKTTIATIDDIIQACDRDALPPHLLQYKKWEPPFLWRVVAPDFDHVHNVIIPTFQEWLPKSQLQGGSFEQAYEKRYNIINFKNGSKCYLKTYEQDPFRHGGSKFHRVRFDEEPPRAIYSENTYRLIDWGGDCLIAMTPVLGLSWTYDAFWVPYTKGVLQDAFIELVDMDDNPHLDEAGKRAALQGSSIEEREARKTGKFVHFHGLVYPPVDDHLIPQSPIPPGSTIYAGIDPGIRHMAAVVFCYHTPDDVLVVFEELGLQGMSVKEVCAEIHLVCAKYDIRPAWYVIDPSARNKQHVTGRSLQQEYADQGIITFAGQNDVRAGINNVKVRMENKALLVQRNCELIVEQFRKYRWVKPARASQDADPREAPIKKDDHLLDALRYLCMARPYKPESERLPEFVDPLLQAAIDDMKRKAPERPAFAY